MNLENFDPDSPAAYDGLFGLPHTHENAKVVVVPVPFEATASYRRGTSNAPSAILQASMQVDLYDIEFGDSWKAGIALDEVNNQIVEWNKQASNLAKPIIENGGADDKYEHELQKINDLMENMNQAVYQKTRELFDNHKIPAIIGGDHSTPYGAIKAASEKYSRLGILHIDAHADLRQAYEGFRWSHASIMFNVVENLPNIDHIVQVGIRDVGQSEYAYTDQEPKITTWYHPEVAFELAGGEPWVRLVNRMLAPLPEHVWISFDADGLDPSLCPNTGTPVPGGLTWNQTLVLLRCLVRSGRKIVGFDLTEVGYDANDEWDAIVGARLLYKLFGWTIRSHES